MEEKRRAHRTTWPTPTAKRAKLLSNASTTAAITRDKDYQLGSEAKNSKMLYLTVNPNGESEVVQVTLTPGSTAKIKVFDYDFAELAIKGRDSLGNVLTKYPVKQIKQRGGQKHYRGTKTVVRRHHGPPQYAGARQFAGRVTLAITCLSSTTTAPTKSRTPMCSSVSLPR